MKNKKKDRPARPFRNVKGNGSKFIESVREAYEPDSEFQEKHVPALVPAFMQKMASKDKPDLIESARIIEVNRFGALKITTLDSSEDFRKAMERATAGKPVLKKILESGIRFRETSKFSGDERLECDKIAKNAKFREDFAVSSTGQGDPFNEYIPLMGGPFNHQLYLHDMLDALAKSFEAWNHNPLAHQIVKITTHFVLGRGVTFKARDPLVHERFAKWWDRMNMTGRLEFWSDMLSRDGELMIRRFINPSTKDMFIRWVDPSTIWEIVTDLEDIERVYYYHQQYPTAFQVLYGANGKDRKFDPTKFGSSKYVINQIPAEEVHHVKINCSPNEKRGRSDLFSILGWLKRYKDFQTAVVLRAIIQSTFAWKNKLTGTNTDVDTFISSFGTDQPEFGSVWVENEASTLEPMTADTNSGNGPADCPGIVNAIGVGAGIPKEYLGMTDHASRATAVVASEPGVKKFQARQILLSRLLKDISQEWFKNEIATGQIPKYQASEDVELPKVMEWAKKHSQKFPFFSGLLNKMIEGIIGSSVLKETDGEVQFEFPEIAIEDRSAKIKDLEIALQDKSISHKRYSTTVAKELGIEDYDYEKEQEDIQEEAAAKLSSLYTAGSALPPVMPGAVSGEGLTAGNADANGTSGNPGQLNADKKKAGGLSGKEKNAIKTSNSQ